MSAERAPPRRLPRHFAKVTRYFPGRGSAFVAPPIQVFYSSKLRARLLWWKQEKAPRRVLHALQKGVDLEFEAGPPTPFSSAPILVSEKDVDFVVQDLEKGERLGAYTPLVAGGENYLSRARVDKSPSSHQRCLVDGYSWIPWGGTLDPGRHRGYSWILVGTVGNPGSRPGQTRNAEQTKAER